MMRTFLTLVPDARTALAIHQWSELCWPGLLRRIPVQNFHLTVAFLGDTDDRALQTLAEVFDGFEHQPINVTLDQVGYWTDSEVLWLGSRKVPEALSTLHAKCRSAANRVGAKGGAKRYQPHITLARKVVAPPAALIEPDFAFTAETLELWSSVRETKGARYSTLASWRLL